MDLVAKPAYSEQTAVVPDQPTDDLGQVGDEHLVALYAAWTSRFIADNSTIWTTAAIFIPVSYSIVVVYFTIDFPSWGVLLGLAVVSSVVSLAWLAIAERHKGFQLGHQARLEAIERRLALPDRRANGADRHQIVLFRSATMRRLLSLGVPVAWAAIALVRAIS